MNESRCPNCDEPISADFCPSCGQRQGELIPPLKTWVSEALDEILLVEARLPRSLRALVWPPGFLTEEWWGGRRSRYVSPLRLYLLAAVPFFVFFTSTIQGDDQEGFFEMIAAIPLYLEGSSYLPPQGPLPPESVNDSVARAEWQREFDRISEHNDSVGQVFSARRERGLGRLFDLLPIAVGLVMVPLLALALWGGTRPRFVARLIFSFHLHIVAYCIWMISTLFGQAIAAVSIGSLVYLTVARRRLFVEPWVVAVVVSSVTMLAYAVCFVFASVALVQLLGSLASGWTYGA